MFSWFRKKGPDPKMLEECLFAADLGPAVVSELMAEKKVEKIREVLMTGFAPTSDLFSVTQKPSVVLMIGVNGVGKTTTAAKIAHFLKRSGKTVLLAAGDTFRAAAIDQLKIWGERIDCEVVAQKPGADSAAVAYDAITKARAKNIDWVLIDTAGRQHTRGNLMEELKKVQRVSEKALGVPPQVWLVLDAQVGQNGIHQAKTFHEALGLSGLIVTKLDGTAKAGILVTIARELQTPILFCGKGEAVEDMEPFSAAPFVESLLQFGP